MRYILITLFTCAALTVSAQNPVIYDRYTPDPAPYVHGDTLYLFVDHDEDETINGYTVRIRNVVDWLLRKVTLR